jgi:hypothetical protein
MFKILLKMIKNKPQTVKARGFCKIKESDYELRHFRQSVRPSFCVSVRFHGKTRFSQEGFFLLSLIFEQFF